jgi:hypothetical protein
MVCASQFSIVGGGSLGPEAPLVAICAALGGFVSRNVFKVSERNLVRKHTVSKVFRFGDARKGFGGNFHPNVRMMPTVDGHGRGPRSIFWMPIRRLSLCTGGQL